MQKRFLLKLCLLPFIIVLASCGGGGSGTKNTTPTAIPKVDLNAKNFSKFAEVTNDFIEASLLTFHQIAIQQYGYSIPTFSSSNGTTTSDCLSSGTRKQTTSLQGAKIVLTFNNCKDIDTIYDGTLSYEFLNINKSKESYSFLLKFNKFATTTLDIKEIVTGSFKTDLHIVTPNNQPELSLKSTINQTIEYPSQNEIFIAKNIVFSGVEVIEDTSGRVEIKSLGAISLNADKVNHRFILKGSDNDIGYIKYGGAFYEQGFISNDKSIDPIGSVQNRHQVLNPSELFANNSAPEIAPIVDFQTNQNTPLTFNFINDAYDINHDVLSFELKVSNTTSDSYVLTKKGFSEFTFNSNIPDSYSIELTVVDPYGLSATQTFTINVINIDVDGDGINNDLDDDDDGDGVLDLSDAFPLDRNESIDTDHDGIGNNADLDDDNDGTNDELDAFPLNSSESLDTDNDGIGNNSDWDDDNDGIQDELDALPLDKNESVDTDGDGIGNNADNDNDNDGVEDTLDLFVFDSRCSSHENGEVCYLKSAATSTQITTSSEGIMYFLIAGEKRVYRWDSASQSFLTAISLGSVTSSDNLVTKMTYSNSHNRLYIGYDSGVVSYIDLVTNIEKNFTTIAKGIGGLASVGGFLLIQDGGSIRYYYNKDGVQTDSNYGAYYSSVYAWNANLNRIYSFRDGISPNDILYEEVDPLSGKRVSYGESPYHGDYSIKPPIVINETGDLVIIGSGSIFNATDLTWAGAIPNGIIDAIWIDSIGLTVIRDSNGSTVLERRDSNSLQVLEKINVNGSPLKILSTSNGYFILSKQNDSLLFTPYIPSNDTDGDGTINSNDSFPLDRAASVDSDNDGYPDYWNMGLTESDSTTGLTLDSYPQDSACYLPEHGDGVTCDVSSTLPNYTPDKTIMGADGIIYLFSKENNKIFRWSITLGDDLSPIIVGSNDTFNSISPEVVAYSENHNRLYLGYGNGKVTYISLSNPQLEEQDFTTVADSVKGLASAGNFLLVQDSSGAWETHYFYNKDGILMDSNDWNHYSRVYAWNATLNRIYFFRDTSSPNDILYEEIDPVTGKRVSYGDSPYHGDYPIRPPILISPDETKVLIGSGNIFNATSLNWDSAIANAFKIGLWATDGDILTLREVSGITRLDHYNSSKAWIGENDYSGIPVGLFEYQNKYYIVTNNSGKIIVTEYTAS